VRSAVASHRDLVRMKHRLAAVTTTFLSESAGELATRSTTSAGSTRYLARAIVMLPSHLYFRVAHDTEVAFGDPHEHAGKPGGHALALHRGEDLGSSRTALQQQSPPIEQRVSHAVNGRHSIA